MKGYEKYFKKVILETYPDKASRLAAEIDSAFIQIEPDIRFGVKSANPIDRRMGIAGYFLATIKVLEKEGETWAKIREIVIKIAEEYVRPRNQFQSFLKRLPAKILGTWISKPLLSYMKKKAGVLSHPQGFAASVITDKEETFGFGYGIDILECGICKLFARHNRRQYASILCEVDHITTGLAGLKMIRTGTIANGAQKCDFRYVKV